MMTKRSRGEKEEGFIQGLSVSHTKAMSSLSRLLLLLRRPCNSLCVNLRQLAQVAQPDSSDGCVHFARRAGEEEMKIYVPCCSVPAVKER